MDKVWLHQLFKGYGEVVDVYIPNKRSSRFNTKFGFVRFKSRDEAERAVQNLNLILIRDCYIHVNLARFSLDSSSRIPLQKACDRVHEATDFPVNNIKSKEFGGDCSPSFANIVAGKSLPGTTVTRFSIKVQDEGNQWLSRSVVAKLPSLRSVESLSEAFIADGVWDIQIRSMGGNFVLLTFPSIEDMNAMLEESGLCWLGNWFDEVNRWKPEPLKEISRAVWLNCYGVPLNVWNAETFHCIGIIWGEVITLDGATSNCSSFDVGKVKISTNVFEAINQTVDLDFNGKVFPVRVVEEHVGVTNFINASCRCNKGCDAKTVGLSKSKEKSEGEMGANMEDMVENSSNNGAEDVNGENKETVVETDPEDDESFDFDVDKAELENEMEIIEEAANSKTANSTSGVKASAWGSGKVMDSMREMAANNTALDINLDPLTFVRLNTCIQIPRASLSNLVDNQDSWVEDSVKKNPVIAENLRGKNVEDENIPEYHIEAFRTENESFSAPIKVAINGVKGKKKRKTIDDILGLTRVNSLNNK
ncbi:hypothetical protein RHGRI_005595 [Rhododendron griersonianum]|uniref:RRM domain-containing protein n=1 Tax=Rhododendron griersonianum TaxID=479676 RepID=A0AAV6LDU6_9ERIC|nr:hypothetical protein RHGRI_005595 [Rhododendron griersonianum]